jgi:hypothetical protein
MKKLLIAIVVLLLVAYFFMFTNIGIGLIELIDDWSKGDPPVPTVNEIVMPPNSTVVATTSAGTISIKSGKGLKRYYTWEEATRSVVMSPRIKRWNGSMGISYPGLGSHWLPKHNGISRAVLEEGQQHFKTLDDAMAWIEKCKQWVPLVYRNDGLLIAYGKALSREQLNVGVWQIMINGQKPVRLNGANDDAVHTSWDKPISSMSKENK